MQKKILVPVLIVIIFLAAWSAIRSFYNSSGEAVYNRHSVWYADIDPATNTGVVIRGSRINEIRGDVAKLVAALNKVAEDEEIERPRGEGGRAEVAKLVLQKIESPTVEVVVQNDQYLTQQIGTSGAQDYLASATYTLTENPSIKSVNFVFSPGEHAMPGLYSRESFTDYRPVLIDNGKR